MELGQFFYQPVEMQYNKIKLEDWLWVPFGLISDTSHRFFEVSKVDLSYYPDNTAAGADPALGFMPFRLSSLQVSHERAAYNIFDLLGDYGGFGEGLRLVVVIILSSYPEHTFAMRAIQKLFFAQTNDDLLFDERFADNKKVKRVELKRRAEVDARSAKDGGKKELLASTRVIKFTRCQSIRLYLHRALSCILCCPPCNNDRLWRLYNKGQERIEKHLDIVKIVQRLGHMKIITKRLVENGTIKLHELYASRKNIIYIDSSDEEQKHFAA